MSLKSILFFIALCVISNLLLYKTFGAISYNIKYSSQENYDGVKINNQQNDIDFSLMPELIDFRNSKEVLRGGNFEIVFKFYSKNRAFGKYTLNISLKNLKGKPIAETIVELSDRIKDWPAKEVVEVGPITIICPLALPPGVYKINVVLKDTEQAKFQVCNYKGEIEVVSYNKPSGKL